LALTGLNRGDDRTTALRAMMAKVMQWDQPRRWYTAVMSGLDTCYDLGEGHPLVGRRMPDLDLVLAQGPVRLFDLLHDARPVLLNLGTSGRFDLPGWADRVKPVDARFEGTCELPVIGPVQTPSGILIRPDGHVAWVEESRTDTGLEQALRAWFGAPRV
jgi:hypothetical protein